MRSAVLLLFVGSLGCRPAGVGSGELSARRAELRAAHIAMEHDARARGMTAAFADVFAPEGYHLAPGLLSPGPAAVRALLQRDTLNAASSVVWTALRVDVAADGRDGYSYGNFDVIRANGDTLPGRYHAYWRRSSGGRWQVLALQRGRRSAGAPSREVPTEIVRRSTTAPRMVARDTTATFQELRDTERAFFDSAGVDLQSAFANFAAPDAAKFPGATASAYVFGREAIAGLFAGAPRGGGPAWRPEIVSAATSGDLGFTFGPAWPRQQGANPPSPPGGRYFTIWRRQPDGSWKYAID
jgi:ketosteroid isomerase-like protein